MTVKRTTIELDQDLLARAQRALGASTARATVEESLRRAADSAEQAAADNAARQLGYLKSLAGRVDPEVLASEQMWR